MTRRYPIPVGHYGIGDILPRAVIPSPLLIAEYIARFKLGEGSRIDFVEINQGIYAIAVDYRSAQAIDAKIIEQTRDRKNFSPLERAVLVTRGRGKPKSAADMILIAGCADLLQRMRGHNAQVGWAQARKRVKGGVRRSILKGGQEWSFSRHKSSLQRFVELVLLIIDPVRPAETYPKESYYGEAKRFLGKTKGGRKYLPKRRIK